MVRDRGRIFKLFLATSPVVSSGCVANLNQTLSLTINVVSLSSYKLSDTETFVLAHGSEFCLPPKINCEEFFAEVEVFNWTIITPPTKIQTICSHGEIKQVGSQIDQSDFLMKTILNDGSKFLHLGLVEDCDNTMKMESKRLMSEFGV